MTLRQTLQPPRRLARRRGMTYIDLIVLTFCTGLGMLIGCYSSCRSTETANRVKCASNLRQIGQAMLLYANENRGAYPRVVWIGGADPTPVWGTGAAGRNPFLDARPNDVTAAMFLLMRTQDITAEVFTCPSAAVEKDNFGGGKGIPLDRSNFSDVKKNLSYSMHNPYVKDGLVPADDRAYWTTNMGAEFAIAADMNPGTVGAGDAVLTPNVSSSAKDMKLGNANNHDKDGQNILYGDGHVAWESNPFVGVNRENIYATDDGRIAASPATLNDSVLLPTDD